MLIVEDDDLTRVSITAVMASAGFDVLASAQTSAEALDAAHQFFPDVALLDLHLGRGPNGIDVAFELRKNDPQIGIVFLTTYEDPRLLSETRDLPQGSQYLLKSNVSNVRDITDAIEHSLQGKSRREKPGRTGVLADLSNVQLATLSLLAQGLSNTEIAKRRHVTEKSVEAVISRLAKSLSLPQSEKTNQRVQLARIYFESTGQFRGSS